MKKLIKLFSVLVLSSIILPYSVYGGKVSAQVKTSKATYLYDFNTNTEISKKNENDRLQIASMTKIMLLNLCYENIEKGNLSIDEEITISDNASGMGGSQVFLESGGVYKVSELLKSVTIASANDASVALAERLYGSEDECVKAMNNKVKELGLKNTQFANCTGLPKPMQYSSAKDIVMIFSDLIKHKSYFDYSNIWLDKIEHKKGSTELANTNKLIRFYDGCDGGKTGFTNEAGYCLTATAKRGNMRLISCVIGAPDSKTRFKETSDLLTYGFNNFENKAVVDKSVPLNGKIAVLNGKIKEVECVPENDFFVFSKRNGQDKIECIEEIFAIKAPIKKGEKVGEISVYKNNVFVGKVAVLANETSSKMNYFDYIKDISSRWAI